MDLVDAKGNLILEYYPNLISLPEGLKIPGNVTVWYCDMFTTMPKGITITGDVNVWDCIKFTTMPSNVTESGNVWVWGCGNFTTMSKGVTVSGEVKVWKCEKFEPMSKSVSEVDKRANMPYVSRVRTEHLSLVKAKILEWCDKRTDLFEVGIYNLAIKEAQVITPTLRRSMFQKDVNPLLWIADPILPKTFHDDVLIVYGAIVNVYVVANGELEFDEDRELHTRVEIALARICNRYNKVWTVSNDVTYGDTVKTVEIGYDFDYTFNKCVDGYGQFNCNFTTIQLAKEIVILSDICEADAVKLRTCVRMESPRGWLTAHTMAFNRLALLKSLLNAYERHIYPEGLNTITQDITLAFVTHNSMLEELRTKIME